MSALEARTVGWTGARTDPDPTVLVVGYLGPRVEDSVRLELEEHDDHVVARVVVEAPRQRPSGHFRCVRGHLAAPLAGRPLVDPGSGTSHSAFDGSRLRTLARLPAGYTSHHEWPHPSVDEFASAAPSHWLQVWAADPEDPGHRLLSLAQGTGMPFDYAASGEWSELAPINVGDAAAQVFLREELGQLLLSWTDPETGDGLTLSSRARSAPRPSRWGSCSSGRRWCTEQRETQRRQGPARRAQRTHRSLSLELHPPARAPRPPPAARSSPR